MMKKLMLLLAFVLTTLTISAVPAKRGLWRTVTLADGTEVRVQKMGDEHLHFWADEAGNAYQVKNGKFVQMAQEQMAQKVRARVPRKNGRRLTGMHRVNMGEKTHFEGEKKGLVILAQYTDVKFKTANNKAKYENILNTENYSVGNFKGSVSDYFKAQSRGKFQLTFDVYGPVTLSHSQQYYGGNDDSGNDQHPEEMIVEACQLVKDEVGDFSKYDWDGDGKADQVFVVYAGKGEADSEDAEDTVWPHMWELSEADMDFQVNGITIDTYACSNEIDDYGNIEGIGCFCHEFSHCMGFPDMYDISYSGWFGMSEFDLMDMGSYNGNAFRPAGYSAYEMMMCSWLEPTELSTDEVAVTDLQPMSNGGHGYIIYNQAHPDEYYLLENRQKTNWDSGLPAKGLMITHVDFDKDIWMDNTPNTKVTTQDKNQYGYSKTNDHQRITIIHADNDDDSKYWVDNWFQTGYTKQTLTGDLYPYGGNNQLTNTSKPAATLYNANTDGKKFMNVSITGIKQNSDGTVAFNYAAGSTGGGEEQPVTGGGDYEKVTSEAQIAVGEKYILVNEEYQMAAGELGKQFFSTVDVTVDGNTVSGEGFTTFTLGGAEDAYTLQMDNGQYLTAQQTKQLKSSDTASAIWQVEPINTDGYVFTTENFGTIQFNYNNGSNPRFMNYTSNQKPAVLYVKKTATAIRDITTAQPATRSRQQGIYTIDGRYVGTDLSTLRRGIYIVDGKKIVK